VLLLAGAVAAVLVLGSDAAPAGPSDRVVPAAIGDPDTVDPCGLVDPAALAARSDGEARVVADLGGPASCVVDAAAPGGDVAVIATLEPVATTVSAAQEERVGALPDVPPLAEAGIPNYNIASWHSVSTTAGVPKDIVDKLASEIRAVMSAPEVQKLLIAEGAIPQISPPPEEFKKFVDSEITRWGELVEKAGILHSQ